MILASDRWPLPDDATPDMVAARTMQRRYERGRLEYRTEHPHKDREACDSGDGRQLELVLVTTMPPASD